MKPTKLAASPSTHQFGPFGETVVPVVKRIISRPDGTSMIEAQLNLRGVAVPERRYVADFAWVDRKNEAARLIFGQYNLTGSALRSLVCVTVFPEPFRQFLTSSKEFFASLSSFLSRNSIEPAQISPLKDEPTQTVALVSNLISASFSGRESVLDFYHVSPAAIMKLAERNDVVLDPVVRVDLATSLLGSLLGLFERVEKALPPEAK